LRLERKNLGGNPLRAVALLRDHSPNICVDAERMQCATANQATVCRRLFYDLAGWIRRFSFGRLGPASSFDSGRAVEFRRSASAMGRARWYP
jgi:hypothetical protein